MSAGRKHISGKKDWNTPPKYVDLINKFFGSVELDPCSNDYSLLKVKIAYKIPVDGLKESWCAKTIFVNPPYGRCMENKTSLIDWVKKGYRAYSSGAEVLFLIPVATNTKHFKDIIFKHAYGICFLGDTRLKFWNVGKEDKKGAPMSCCLVYFGDDYSRFTNIFMESGKCFKIKDS